MKKDKYPYLFIYAGLDFILDKTGIIRFVEANDHPVGLYEADLLSTTNESSIFYPKGISSLSSHLTNHCHDKYICLLLPDCFRIEKYFHNANSIEVKEKYLYEGRVKLTVDDFNQLYREIYKNNKKVKIADASGIRWNNNRCFFTSGEEIGSLYRRSSIPKRKVDVFCINDIRMRAICTDKSLVTSLLSCSLQHKNLIKNFSIKEILDIAENKNNSSRDIDFIVCKPNNSSASIGVSRVKLQDLTSCLKYNNKYIFQPWIEPDTIQDRKNSYYYDIRVFVIGGKVISGFARRAAAPISGIAEDSPLSWCTTTGPKIPIISPAQEITADNHVVLTDKQVKDLFDLSEKIVLDIDRYACSQDYDRFDYKLINFNILHNINDKMQYIKLTES